MDTEHSTGEAAEPADVVPKFNGQFIIRVAKPVEYPAIGQLIAAVYSQLEGFPKDTEMPGYYRQLREVGRLAELSGTEILVAIDEDQRQLGALVYFYDMRYYGAGGSATEEADAAGFRFLAVAPFARRWGVGRALTNACIRRARAQGRNTLVLHSTGAMVAARRMYAALGFQRAEELDFKQGELQVYGFRLPLCAGQ